MSRDYLLAEETLGYQTSNDPSNSDKRLLGPGSQNVFIDYQKKAKIRPGYYRLGAANPALTEVRNAWTWMTSTVVDRPQRFYDDELEVYLFTVDTVAINAWTRVKSGWSTTNILRKALWYDTTENIDLQLMVQGDDNIYEWGGGVSVVLSVTGTTITKNGTTTWAQNRFYATRNKILVNVRTGTEYTYTGGETSLTLTGISDTTGIIAGDILVQKVVTQTDTPSANKTNDFIFVFENQVAIGSASDQEVAISQNDTYTDFTFSAPRAPGEGALLTLDTTCRAFGTLGKLLIIFAGRSYAYQVEYDQLEVGTSIAETIKVKRLDLGVDQGALNQESVVQISNSLAYLSNEVALRIISNPEDLTGINPKTFSNPIKPDFDNEDWDPTKTFGFWFKNTLLFSSGGGRTYMLNFVEDADGKLLRFWNPPQTLPIGPFSQIDSGNGYNLYGHSNAVPESYLLFTGYSDGQFDGMTGADKLPIDAWAYYSYDSMGKRARLKNFDEYYVEGEITPNTNDLELDLNYDYGGATQIIQEIIDGSDETLLEGTIEFNSLAQQSLGVQPLGGLLNPPVSARRFRIEFEEAKEDFFQLQAVFHTNATDRYWAIIAHGSNAELSNRRPTNIRK